MTSAVYEPASLPDLLPLYYRRLFPFSQYYRWLNYGGGKCLSPPLSSMRLPTYVLTIMEIYKSIPNPAIVYFSSEELLSASRVLVHFERWHLRPLPILQYAEWAGERDAEDEPLQDWHRRSVQSQGRMLTDWQCNVPSLPLHSLFPSFTACCGLFTFSPVAKSTQHSQVWDLPGSGEGAGVWYWYDWLWWRA